METPQMTLHGYFRSTAAWRVRIALGLKGIAYDRAFHHLRRGEQRAADYLAVNPQGFVPALVTDDGAVLTQSLAIVEFLDETHRAPPLLPPDPLGRARARAFALAIACDIHPLQNLTVLERLRGLGLDEAAVQDWARAAIDRGLTACEALIGDGVGPFAFGAAPGLADLCLVPQLYNARRFGVDLRWPRLAAVEAACAELPAFTVARPENQPDAE
jgi:maleylpyruvate isomerase